MRTFRPSHERGGFSVAIVMFVVMVFALWYGIDGVYVALKNPQPLTLKCADLAKGRPSAHWLVLKDCEINVNDIVFLQMKRTDKPVEWISTVYLPLRPAGNAGAGSQCYAMLVTKNPKILSIVNEFSKAATEAEWQFLTLKHAAAMRQRRDVTGLVQSGIRNVDTSTVAYSKLTRYLAPNFILIDEDTKPHLGLSVGALGVGLCLAGFMVYRMSKESGPETYEIS